MAPAHCSRRCASVRGIWAVGDSGDACTMRPLIEHWNGRRWAVKGGGLMPGGGLGVLAQFQIVTASDIWAVGKLAAEGAQSAGGIPIHRKAQLTRPLDRALERPPMATGGRALRRRVPQCHVSRMRIIEECLGSRQRDDSCQWQ